MKTFILVAALIAGACASLTADEAGTVKSTWGQVKNKENDILYAIFKENPTIQAAFPMFAGKNLDEIKSTETFEKHADKIVSAVGSYVELLGDDSKVPAIKTLLNQLGSNHKNRGASKDQFLHFKASVLKFIKGHVTGWTDASEHAWNKAFDEMYKIVFASLDGHPVA